MPYAFWLGADGVALSISQRVEPPPGGTMTGGPTYRAWRREDVTWTFPHEWHCEAIVGGLRESGPA